MKEIYLHQYPVKHLLLNEVMNRSSENITSIFAIFHIRVTLQQSAKRLTIL